MQIKLRFWDMTTRRKAYFWGFIQTVSGVIYTKGEFGLWSCAVQFMTVWTLFGFIKLLPSVWMAAEVKQKKDLNCVAICVIWRILIFPSDVTSIDQEVWELPYIVCSGTEAVFSLLLHFSSVSYWIKGNYSGCLLCEWPVFVVWTCLLNATQAWDLFCFLATSGTA